MSNYVVTAEYKNALLALLLTAACGCPRTEAPAVSSKYSLEMTAACSAVDGCAPAFMASVRVYEARSKDEVEELCSNEFAYGCFCERPGCASIVLLNPSGRANHYDSNALHEAVHAAWASVGAETHEHGPEFEEALVRARVLLRAELGLE